ncbi:adenylosuccinate lyase [Singulisphaera sp. GP187]|uniref:adenylosuccinate lyase n=1 Tax=Singulisphaera sp. GP187 TaxID=1882752 RepID=UPI00092C42C1|nr:adenylosuccinate lyase [Singulisphaera sp. GP187]SIN84103.1 adenylosuccinate lyase [Singulisphaera sp. GP187]
MNDHHVYQNPLITRYASREMAELWSSQRKFSTWRRLWVALAEAERALGLNVSEAQIAELRANVDQIDFEAARKHEKRLRHDVMAHVHTLGDAAPSARAIIHLGATSCFVTDNTDLILIREGLSLIRDQLVGAIDGLAEFAVRWKDLPCLGYTHFQPAQLVTVGKRATLWCYELILDYHEIERRIAALRFLGVKGTTGTQASFLALFDGDHAKVEELDRRVAAAFGFDGSVPVSGQTYTRKVDSQATAALAGIAETAHRFGSDLRLLAHERELDEPFEAEQIGSSAMAYKRNPMRAERMCSIARFAMGLAPIAGQTAATQWLERTLDDSAVRRLVLPQAFLAVDAVLNLYLNVVPGFVVHPAIIGRHVRDELPFMATENLLMAGVQAGGDRQELHERVRIHSLAAAARLKEGAGDNDLIDRLRNDPAFAKLDFETLLDPLRFVGRAPEQVVDFVTNEVEPIRRAHPNLLGQKRDVDV